MKKIKFFSALLSAIMLFSIVACEKKDVPKPNPKPKPKPEPEQKAETISPVSQFVYDGLSLYYLWANNMKAKKPTANDKDPEKYFYSLLHPTDTQHGWSWITDDVEALLSGFSGESNDAFGFVPSALWADKNKTSIVGFVKFVYPNTPAAAAGLKRGDVITKINGSTMTKSNFQTMYGAKQKVTFTVLDQNYENPRDVDIVPGKIETDPVLYTNIYEIDGKKIGYIFYTQYIYKYNNSLFEAFKEFKSAGVTDLVLDLRYNHGGAISAASYLASLIAPREAVEKQSPLTVLSYNSFLNTEFDNAFKQAKEEDKYKYDRKDYLGTYGNGQQNPLQANLNLNKVYIIATGDSFSASELTTFCLKPYLEVVHIGSKTGGKYTASWTIHAYDGNKGAYVYDPRKMSVSDKNTLKNWAMQPIVARYTDKNGKDFIDTDGLIPDYEIESQENDTKKWKPIGDVEDYLFAKAISLITGRPYTNASTRSARAMSFVETEFSTPHDKIIKESVILDNPKISPTEINELLQLRRAQVQEEKE